MPTDPNSPSGADVFLAAAQESLDQANRVLVRQAKEISDLETRLALAMEFVQACAECVYSSYDESGPADVINEVACAILEKFGLPYRTDYAAMPDYGQDPRFRVGHRRQLTRGCVGANPEWLKKRLIGAEPIGTGLSAL
jgi:hypothetical protein